MLFVKQILNHARLLLPTMQMAAHGGNHVRLVGGPALAQGVGFDILIEQLIGIQLRTVARQMDQAQPLRVVGNKLLCRR